MGFVKGYPWDLVRGYQCFWYTHANGVNLMEPLIG